MIQINLLPDVKQEFLRAKRTRNTVISISILSGLASVGLVVLATVWFGIHAAREVVADNNIESRYAQLTETDDLSELVTLQAQLNSISQQHTDKVMTSRMFSVLQVINPGGENDVQFSSIQLEPKENTLRLEGATLNGYTAVEALVKTISNTNIEFTKDDQSQTEPLASQVSVGESGLAEDVSGRRVVRFQVTISTNELLFSNQATEMRIRGPSRQIDVTDSRIGVPESLFIDAPREEDDE